MPTQRLQIIGLSIVFGITAIIILLMWMPYLKLVALGAILAILFLPVYNRILRKKPNRTLAAALTLLIIILIVIVPLYLIGQALFNEIVGVYNSFLSGQIVINKDQIIHALPGSLQGIAGRLSEDLNFRLADFARNAFTSINNLITSVAGVVLTFFLTMFTTYYLLRDGVTIKRYINSILPLSEEHENLLVTKLESAVSEVVKGSFLVALIQGATATIGFLIFGVPNAFLWGAFTVMAALVPNIGTAIAMVPIVLYLFISGHTGAGIGMAIWGALAVGTIDNIVGPRLVGSRTHLHPLLVLFSVLGGIQLFGFVGFLLGPIIMAVFVTLVDIYRNDLQAYLKN